VPKPAKIPVKPKAKARRRSHEEARALLMDAAEGLFAERGPDAYGLRDIAQQAGVSHGLITHYFKTYEGLVEAVFARRAERIAAAVVAKLEQSAGAPAAHELITLLLAAVSEPAHLRLVAWAALSGRSQSIDFLPGRQRGLRVIADAVLRAATLRAERAGTPPPSQDDVDYAIVLALCATYGYGLGKTAFLRALGREMDSSTDEAVMGRLSGMLQGLLSPPRD
jgi:TetR/AcrR family transcriptional regulator, repressor for neighboring sulfatase